MRLSLYPSDALISCGPGVAVAPPIEHGRQEDSERLQGVHIYCWLKAPCQRGFQDQADGRHSHKAIADDTHLPRVSAEIDVSQFDFS
jgi:hypothetical protein